MEEKFADAVVVAAGVSRRMGGVDKLEADICGRPLLAWSIDAMAARSVRRVIVVAPADRVDSLAAAPWLRERNVEVVAGGAERTDSVLAGVRVSTADVVLVHDGARPLATPALADSIAAAAAKGGAAIPVVPLADSLKSTADGRVTGAVDRDGLTAAQTPQGTRRSLLMAAAEATAGRSFTDEAGMLAAHGVEVVAVPGEAANIKVTRVEDLDIVRALAAARLGNAGLARTGFGEDSHQFGPADGLWLGGVLIPDAPRLRGHSDGDAALHALTTALLSSVGLGDIGRAFPATEPATAGAQSADFVRGAVARAAASGWRPLSASISISAARPRLGASRIDAMRDRVAELLGLSPSDVAITASSGNQSGAEGRGLAIGATALVSVVRA